MGKTRLPLHKTKIYWIKLDWVKFDLPHDRGTVNKKKGRALT